MGSWYGTCGISQLPITYGDEVALFVLSRNQYTQIRTESYTQIGGSFVNSYDLYHPICLPVFGTYYDYGVIENITDLNDTVLTHLKLLKICSNGEKYEIKDLKSFIKQIERREIDNYGFMMVHKDLLDNLVNHISPMNLLYTEDLGIRECLERDAIELLKIIKDNNLMTYDFVSRDFKNFDFIHDKRVLSNKFRWKTEDYLRYYREPKLYKNNPELLDIMIDFLLFIEIMEYSRKLWMPQAGSGSQDREYEYAELIGDFAKSKKIEMDEEW